MNKIKQLAASPWFTKASYALVAAIILLATFQAGVHVGFHKAGFSGHMGEKYYRAFGEGRHGFAGNIDEHGFPSAHGAIGRVIKTASSSLVVVGPDRIEKTVNISRDTEVLRFRDKVSYADITPGTYVVVIGSPNDNAEITARLIRILPPPPEGFMDNIAPVATGSSINN